MTDDGISPVFTMKRAGGTIEPAPAAGTGTLAPAGTGPVVPAGTNAGTDAGTGWYRPTGTDSGTSGTSPSATVVPAFGTDLVPVPAGPARASARVRLIRRAKGRIAETADYQRRHRTFWYAIWVFITRPPETAAETERHLESRKWLQEWMTGRLRVFCEWENVAWGHLVSIPGRAALQLVEKVFFERQSRFWIAVGVIALGLIIRLAGHL
jgi:hypothetical protein